MDNEAKKWMGSNTANKTLKYVSFIYLQSVPNNTEWVGIPKLEMNMVKVKLLDEQWTKWMGILADPIIGMGGSFKAEMVTTMSWTLVLRTYEYKL